VPTRNSFPIGLAIVVGCLLIGAIVLLVWAPGEEAATEADLFPASDTSETLAEPVPADTLLSPDDRTRRRAAAASVGVAVGLNRWPSDKWCDGPMTGSVQSMSPKLAGGLVRKATQCGYRIFGAMPRSWLTHNGEMRGRFSLPRAKAACDALAKVLPPDTLKKYVGKVLLGDMLGDELQSQSWEGSTDPNDAAEYARYCQNVLPGLPLAFRIPPSHQWVRSIPAERWPRLHWWAQWLTARGNKRITNDSARQIDWYNTELAAAKRLGGDLIRGFNARDCDKANSGNYCTPDQIRTFGSNAINHGSCLVAAWWYEEQMWNDAARRAAWNDVGTLARSKPFTVC
jgi:hypothetical protein